MSRAVVEVFGGPRDGERFSFGVDQVPRTLRVTNAPEVGVGAVSGLDEPFRPLSVTEMVVIPVGPERYIALDPCLNAGML